MHQARRDAGQPLTRWAAAHLVTALDLAVRGRGWPPDRAASALLQVAADPSTRSPAQLAEAGPWWDEPTTTTDTPTVVDAPRSKPSWTPSTANGFSYSNRPANN